MGDHLYKVGKEGGLERCPGGHLKRQRQSQKRHRQVELVGSCVSERL